jgi:hypothetical protein
VISSWRLWGGVITGRRKVMADISQDQEQIKMIFTFPVLIGIRFPEIMSKSQFYLVVFITFYQKLVAYKKSVTNNGITNHIGNSSACLKIYVS